MELSLLSSLLGPLSFLPAVLGWLAVMPLGAYALERFVGAPKGIVSGVVSSGLALSRAVTGYLFVLGAAMAGLYLGAVTSQTCGLMSLASSFLGAPAAPDLSWLPVAVLAGLGAGAVFDHLWLRWSWRRVAGFGKRFLALAASAGFWVAAFAASVAFSAFEGNPLGFLGTGWAVLAFVALAAASLAHGAAPILSVPRARPAA